MKKLSIALLVVILILSSFEYASALKLTVSSPRTNFSRYPGTIEDIKMTLKSHGFAFDKIA